MLSINWLLLLLLVYLVIFFFLLLLSQRLSLFLQIQICKRKDSNVYCKQQIPLFFFFVSTTNVWSVRLNHRWYTHIFMVVYFSVDSIENKKWKSEKKIFFFSKLFSFFTQLPKLCLLVFLGFHSSSSPSSASVSICVHCVFNGYQNDCCW